MAGQQHVPEITARLFQQIVFGAVAALLVAALTSSEWWYHQHVDAVVEFYGTQPIAVVRRAAGLLGTGQERVEPAIGGQARIANVLYAWFGLGLLLLAARGTDDGSRP